MFKYKKQVLSSLLLSINHGIQVVYTHGVRKILIPGSYVVVKGRTNPDCLRFSVDFTCGARSMVDGLIALHFNPRLQEGYVVRNCLINGAWGDEETTSTTPLSLRIDEAFELEFFVTGEEFMVSINGRHFCSFRHRVPLERITTIDFIGDLQIDDVETTFTEVYSFMKDEHIYTIPHNERYEDDDNLNLDVPFFGRFQQELNVGGQIEICGKVKLLPHSFYVNLQCGHTLVPHPLVPLHLNPRFSASCGSNAFVRNCWIDGKWLREERAPGFPFSPGYSFTMIIGVEESGYAVWVNKKLIAEYPYQELLGRRKITVDSMYIQGDISLHHVSVHTTRKAVHYDFSRELSGLRL